MKEQLWDFDYRPVAGAPRDDGGPRRDLVVATEHDVDPATIIELVASLSASFEVTPLVSSHPIYWTRLRSSIAIDRNEVVSRLEHGGIRVRYVACARYGSQQLASALELTNACPRRGHGWKPRAPELHVATDSRAGWFLGLRGIHADRRCCGTGTGTRVAVIDNDSAAVECLNLDAEIMIGPAAPVHASHHAALLVGWTVGTRYRAGVAPDASPRLYVIPKPGQDVVSLPVAIVRAVDDGADVIVCATYIDDVAGPLLDDALELATCLGRAERGAAVLFPTSREISSPSGSMHASLSLSLAAPASHPRAFCIGPSGADGGWFLWRERSGRLRPFANRGPAVRWLAPGDDMPDPLTAVERIAHAESSGAAGVAAGVVLLVLAKNPELTRSELDAILTATTIPPSDVLPDGMLADAWDGRPVGRDQDGHDAKHGYGRLSARRACLSAADPIAATLIRIGDDDAAASFAKLYSLDPDVQRAYSSELARWAVRALLADAALWHALAALLRHVRLICRHHARAAAHPDGALLHQFALLVRLARSSPSAPKPPESVLRELVDLARVLLEHSAVQHGATMWENAVYSKLSCLWVGHGEASNAAE